jgi:hypothetical protein
MQDTIEQGQGVNQPPPPADSHEQARWDHTRLRWRMLNGLWRPDLESRVRQQVGTQRAEAWKSVDMSSNVLASTSSQLASVYNEPPTFEHQDTLSRVTVERLLARAG